MQGMPRWVFLGCLALMVFLVGVGCDSLDRFVALKENLKAADIGKSASQPVVEESAKKGQDGAASGLVTLYFSDPFGKYLAQEKRQIAPGGGTAGMIRGAVQGLLDGPSQQSGLLPTIPVGTRVHSIRVDEVGVCTVDFSRELVANHSGGSTSETLTVYSIVNTLTQFPSVQKVKIFVDGKPVDTLAGHMDVSEALARNSRILQK